VPCTAGRFPADAPTGEPVCDGVDLIFARHINHIFDSFRPARTRPCRSKVWPAWSGRGGIRRAGADSVTAAPCADEGEQRGGLDSGADY